MNQFARYSFHSTNSQYSRRNHKTLINFLIYEFGFSQTLAIIFITIHQCSDQSQLISLFILNYDHHYQHLFIPNSSNLTTAICQVCKQKHDYHIAQISWQQLINFQQQAKLSLSYIQQPIYDNFGLANHSSTEQITNFIQNNNNYHTNTIQKPSKYNLITCSICYQNFDKIDMIHINQHLHQICIPCMSKYLKQQIINLRIQILQCPHCTQPLTPQTIKLYVSNTIYQKYQIFSQNISIQNNPNLRWCPNPKCSIIISLTTAKKTIQCPKCNTYLCTKCNQQAHPNTSCDQFIKNILQNLQNATDIQKCKKCNSLVQKISGCNHMTCRVCKYQWCWLCGSTYSDIHFSPLNPLGCAGMQNLDRPTFGKCRVYIKRILMIIGFLILLPIILPLIMICAGPVVIYSYFSKKIRNCSYLSHCSTLLLILMSIPLGIIINPFVWIGAIIYFTPSICTAINNWFTKRRNIIEQSEKQIKRKLLTQGQDVFISI